jgi:tetratricopeptide (TPR) repeat protein
MIALQDFDKALSTFQALLTHLRKRFGYTHFGVAIILNNIGICHYEFGGLLAALKSFEEAVEILRDAIKNCQEDSDEMNHLLILLGRSLNNLSFIRFKRKEYAEAVVALEEGLKVQRDTFGKNHKLVKSTIENLGFMMATANCFDNKDKLDHMAKMYVEMLGQ